LAEALTLRTAMLLEMDDEESRTLRTLERVPQERWDWSPHEKSTPMGRLGAHIATLPQIAVGILTTTEFDMVANRGALLPPPAAAADLVPVAQARFHEARKALEAATDADLQGDWTFRFGDQVMFGPGPRVVALRTFFLSHIIHHRGQLGVYLRLCGVPVPSTSGPSADEPR
jgi:uncharacterized damage-inducible protein DinB